MISVKSSFSTAFALSILAATASANDGWYVGIGGAPGSLKKHPTIRMVQEVVHINPVTGKVRAEFKFRNEGKATTVTMGFPEEGSNGLKVRQGERGFSQFETRVDGERVPAKMRIVDADEYAYKIWWTKEVDFSENQLRTVIVEYESDHGYDSVGGRVFRYVLGTGATWKGKIGSAKIVLDISDLKHYSAPKFTLKPSFHKGNTVEWHFVNFEPKKDMVIGVDWFGGFLAIFFNGQKIRENDNWPYWDGTVAYSRDDSVPTTFGSAPTRHGSDVFASPRLAAHLLSAQLTYDPKTAAVTLRLKDGTWAKLKPGDHRLWTDRGIRKLDKAPFLKANRLRVPLAAIVRAVGGKSSWRRGALYLDRPKTTVSTERNGG